MPLKINQIMGAIRFLTSQSDFINNKNSSDQDVADWDNYLNQRRKLYPYNNIEINHKINEKIKSILILIPNIDNKNLACKYFDEIKELIIEDYGCNSDYVFQKGILEGFILSFNILEPMIKSLQR